MNIGQFLKTLKPFAINKKTTNESFVNEAFETFNQDLIFDKTRVSRILNCKEEIPNKIKESLRFYQFTNNAKESFCCFVEDTIDSNYYQEISDTFTEKITNDHCFSNKEKEEILNSKDNVPLMLSLIWIRALKENNRIVANDDKYIWKNGSNHIRVVYGDLFDFAFSKRSKKQRIVVIPVDTTFDTHLSTKQETEVNPKVSSETIHGKMLSRLYIKQLSKKEIDKRILDNLKANKLIRTNAKNISAPIGTIARLDFENVTFYLIAIAKFNKTYNAHSTKADITKAIEKLAEYYDKKGQGYEIYIPLIGTGMSRSGLTCNDSYHLIESIFTERLVQGKVNIVIHPDNADEVYI